MTLRHRDGRSGGHLQGARLVPFANGVRSREKQGRGPVFSPRLSGVAELSVTASATWLPKTESQTSAGTWRC